MRRHIKQVHEGVRYACKGYFNLRDPSQPCKFTGLKQNLENHIKRHKIHRKFCQYCGKSFATSYELGEHEVVCKKKNFFGNGLKLQR